MDNSVVRDITRRLKELEADLAACAAQLADAEAAHETIARKVENYRGMLADYSQWKEPPQPTTTVRGFARYHGQNPR